MKKILLLLAILGFTVGSVWAQLTPIVQEVISNDQSRINQLSMQMNRAEYEVNYYNSEIYNITLDEQNANAQLPTAQTDDAQLIQAQPAQVNGT